MRVSSRLRDRARGLHSSILLRQRDPGGRTPALLCVAFETPPCLHWLLRLQLLRFELLPLLPLPMLFLMCCLLCRSLMHLVCAIVSLLRPLILLLRCSRLVIAPSMLLVPRAPMPSLKRARSQLISPLRSCPHAHLPNETIHMKTNRLQRLHYRINH